MRIVHKSKLIKKGKPKILGFMHIATMNHWEEIVEELVYYIDGNGLLSNTNQLLQVTVGPEHKAEMPKYGSLNKKRKKIKRFSAGFDLRQYEYPTLNRLWETCKATDDEFYVYYCHTKGASYRQNFKSDIWRRVMAEAVLGRSWRECVVKLDEGNNTCGIMIRNGHYSGNFWWAKASYIRTLRKPLRSSNRFIHETWLSIRGNASCPVGYPVSTRGLGQYWYSRGDMKMYKLVDV